MYEVTTILQIKFHGPSFCLFCGKNETFRRRFRLPIFTKGAQSTKRNSVNAIFCSDDKLLLDFNLQ